MAVAVAVEAEVAIIDASELELMEIAAKNRCWLLRRQCRLVRCRWRLHSKTRMMNWSRVPLCWRLESFLDTANWDWDLDLDLDLDVDVEWEALEAEVEAEVGVGVGARAGVAVLVR